MSVRLLGLQWTNFVGAGLPESGEPENGTAEKRDAWSIIRRAMRGESLLPECADCIGPGAPHAELCSEYQIRPFEDSCLCYDVRYELVLRSGEDKAISRTRRPYLGAERLTYVEMRGEEKTNRRKAFDTMGLSRFKGIHPRDIMFAMGRSRSERAQISALRLLAEGLGKSFFFLDEFRPLVQKTARLRPGAFFLRALQSFARDPESCSAECGE